jgi:DNA-binding CsgD family transcriptional regulator
MSLVQPAGRSPGLPADTSSASGGERAAALDVDDRGQPLLVGRTDEVAAIEAFLARAASDGAAMVVTGDAGIGKSALLAVAARRADARWGTRVLRASGAQFEQRLSYSGLHQLLLPLATDPASGPARMPGAHGDALRTALGLQAGTAPDRLLLTSAVLALLQQLSAEAPVLLVVDDVHWLDRASAGALGLVARRLDGTHVGLLLAQRTGEESFFDRTTVEELHVAPLADDAAKALVERLHPGAHPSVRHRIVTDGGGNPLALTELGAGMTAAQESAAEPLPATLPLTERLRRLFAARISALPAPTRRLLLLAALDDGARAGDALVAMVSGSDADLAPAEAAGLVSVDRHDHRVRFAHPLVRAAVVDHSSAPERRAAHRRLAELTADPDVRALHRAEAALGPDEAVARRLVGVAERALDRGDAVRAVSLLLRAAELSTEPQHRAGRMAEAAFIGAHVTGALSGAGELLARARAEHPGVTDTLQAATAAAAHLLNLDGDIDTAHGILVGALAGVSADARHARAIEAAVATLMMVCSFGGRAQLWRAFDDAVVQFDDVLSDTARTMATTFGDPVRSTPAQLRDLDRLVNDLDGVTNPVRALQVGQARWYVGDIPRAPLERVVAAATTGDTVALGAQALVMLAVDDFFRGRWNEAAALGEQAVAECERHGYALLLWGARLPGMLLAAACGDAAHLDTARARMRQWALPRGALAVRTFTAYVDGLAALTLAHHGDALELYRSVSQPGSFPPHEQVTPWMVMDLVEAAVRSGDLEAAGSHVTAAMDAGIPRLSPRSRFQCLGAAALAAGDDEYVRCYEDLLDDPTSTQWPFLLARLELAYGERLRRDRAMRRARPHLERALGRFQALGAAPWAERAEAVLAATGPTRRVGAEESSQLTAQELQIARLAASGLSNREIGAQLFVSPRTVGAHLYRVFPKLGISSRAALRDALTARGH